MGPAERQIEAGFWIGDKLIGGADLDVEADDDADPIFFDPNDAPFYRDSYLVAGNRSDDNIAGAKLGI